MRPQSNTQGAGTNQLKLLTTWRFFAAALVVLFHYGQQPLSDAPVWFRRVIENGYAPVIFFFVLSGFVLVFNYHDTLNPSGLRGGPGRFWIARVARICPTYFLGLILVCPFLLYSGIVKRTIPWCLSSEGSLPVMLLAIVAVPLLLQAWMPPVALAWNAPAWSLSVEAFFYLGFPKLVKHFLSKSTTWCFFTSLALVIAVDLGRYLYLPLSESVARSEVRPTVALSFIGYFPLFHLPTFMFGMALGKFYLHFSANRRLPYQSLVLVGSCGLLLFLFSEHGRISPVFESGPCLVPLYGTFIFSSASCMGMVNRVLSQSWLVELGESSYAMYILHVPLFWWASWLRERVPAFAHKHDLLFFGCYFVVLMCLCVLVYEYYEKPAKQFIRSRLTARLLPEAKAKALCESA